MIQNYNIYINDGRNGYENLCCVDYVENKEVIGKCSVKNFQNQGVFLNSVNYGIDMFVGDFDLILQWCK